MILWNIAFLFPFYNHINISQHRTIWTHSKFDEEANLFFLKKLLLFFQNYYCLSEMCKHSMDCERQKRPTETSFFIQFVNFFLFLRKICYFDKYFGSYLLFFSQASILKTCHIFWICSWFKKQFYSKDSLLWPVLKFYIYFVNICLS